MDKIWYLYVSGQQLGPMSLDEVRSEVASGRAKPTDYVYRPGMDNWKPISTVDEVQAAPTPPPIPQAQPQALASAAAQPVAASDSAAMAEPLGVEIKADLEPPKQPKKQKQEDLSVLMEMGKDDFEEQTGRIDASTLKQAKKEARALGHVDGAGGSRLLKYGLIVLIAAAAIAYLFMQNANAQTRSRTQQRAPAQQRTNVDRVDVESLKKKYWETGDPNEVRVVQNRLYTKQGRLEIGVFGSTVSSDPFVKTRNAGGALSYHFSEAFSLGFVGWKSFSSDSVAQKTLEEETDPPQRSATNFQRSYYGGEIAYSPIYGKLSLFGLKIVHFDIHFMGGAGMVGGETGSYFAPSLGVGQKLFLNNSIALRVDYRYLRFREVAKATTKSIKRNNNTNVISVGFSLFL